MSAHFGCLVPRCVNSLLVEAIAEVCRRLAREERLRRVCFSGGTFQNYRLLWRAVQLIRASDLDLFLHAKVSPNDGAVFAWGRR